MSYYVASASPVDKVLGVSCTQSDILLAVAKDQEILCGYPQKIEAAELLEASERLQGLLDRIERMLDEVSPSIVRVLMPEQTHKAAYSAMVARAAMETLVRLAAVKKGLRVEVLARPTLRSRLKLPKKGRLSQHVSLILPDPSGQYWSEGRNLAALAAIANG